jgi:hypothetical protein
MLLSQKKMVIRAIPHILIRIKTGKMRYGIDSNLHLMSLLQWWKNNIISAVRRGLTSEE